MGNFALGYFGSGRGVLTRVNPLARIISGICGSVLCVVSFRDPMSSIILSVIMVFVFVLISGLDLKTIARLLLLSVFLFAPFILSGILIAFGMIADDQIHAATAANPLLAQPFVVSIKGMGCILIVLATLSTLTFHELTNAIAVAPMSNSFRLITIQILQQTSLLLDETRRIAQVLTLRGTSSRARTTIAILKNIATVWLMRVINRSNRVALCMEARGYTGVPVQSEAMPFERRDRIVAGGVASLTVLFVLYRVMA